MATYYCELVQLLPQAQFVPCSRIFDQIRAVKELREIKLLSRAGLQTVCAIEATVKMTRVVESENNLAVRMIKNMFDGGAQSLEFMCLGVACALRWPTAPLIPACFWKTGVSSTWTLAGSSTITTLTSPEISLWAAAIPGTLTFTNV